jgi:uncharacterized membrane protein
MPRHRVPGQLRFMPKESLRCLRFLATGLLFLALAWPVWAGDPATALAQGAPSGKVFQWHPFLAPFHSVVLHLPIGFLMMAFILELYRLGRPSEELKRVVTLVVWFSLLSGITTAAFGILRAGGGGYEPHAVELHRWTGLFVPVCTLATLALQRWAYRSGATGVTFAFRSSLFCTLALLVVAGHFGGNLTHGSGYLVENAPAFVRDLLEPARPADSVQPGEGTEQQQFYTHKVEPILKEKCYRCHGPEKQKSGYRLDQPELALKGGESGKAAIKPGDVLGSNLARLILLPPDHDDVMPPRGKEPLKLEELMNIVHWIRSGAVFAGGSKVAAGP